MTSTPSSSPRRIRRAAALAATAALALGAAGCGAKGGSDASGTKTTTTASTSKGGGSTDSGSKGSSDTTTTEAPTTTTAASGGGDVTQAQLKAALPTAADIGSPYELDPSGSSSSDSADKSDDAELEKACPDAAAFFNSTSNSKDDVESDFKAPDGREIDVSITRDTSSIPEDKVDEIVKALNACTQLSFKTSDGTSMTGSISAQRVKGIGDYAVQIDFNFEATVSGAPVKITVAFKGLLFARNGLGGAVAITSGLDDTTFQPVPGDWSKAGPLAQDLDAKLKALTE